MRVTLVAETFTPAVNGVVNSVRQVVEQLTLRGHEATVIAPSGESYRTNAGRSVEVFPVPSLDLPHYRGLSIARPSLDLTELLDATRPDIVHLASPAVLGSSAVRAANSLDVPSVAVFQTDLAAFVSRYRMRIGTPFVWSWLRRIHNSADLTLAPSSAIAYRLRRQGISPVAMWGRGVDGELFRPARRDANWHEDVSGGRMLVGFVGRLAPEKRVEMLEPVSRLDGVQLVVIGDGPRRRSLQRQLPNATFTGQLTGMELATAMASLDLLVNPGADETFCQVVQEALRSGVPVIAAASGGPLDLVRHGDNGWLWAGDDPHLLAAQVGAVRDDRAQLDAVRGRTVASVAGRTWGRVTDQLIAHYRRVLAARAARQLDTTRAHA
ncbi:MAG TPA: glycosyltransferase family 1 protein [Jatrophihabitantaceae bacterium]|nr:glycosyltransferase family 1 protein [Jatrophihabitantaceae bacterium]